MPNLSSLLPEPRFARLCVISPHLDDAVLSSFATLTDSGGTPCQVVTVVTKGIAGQVTPWSTLTGFVDTAREHEARRTEDIEALALLEAGTVHLGGISGDAHSIAAAVSAFIREQSSSLRQSRILLPAGAGRQASLLERAWRRLKHEPDVQGPHPEHVQVRDAFEKGLRAAGITEWGYYAELPYARHEPLEACRSRLQKRVGASLYIVRRMPETTKKLQATECYASQARVALGETPADRTAFCGHAEYLFIRPPAPR
jgi:LmbE family N-acetylglucosaminyl deacetylase